MTFFSSLVDAIFGLTPRTTLQAMKPVALPRVAVEPELQSDQEVVLGDTETISNAFAEQSVRGAVNYRAKHAEVLARAKQAFRQYQRSGQPCPVDGVVDRVQNRIDARRPELLTET